MEKEKIKKLILENVQWTTENKSNGQCTNMVKSLPVVLISDELNIKITVGYHRQSDKNKELALLLLNKTIDELIIE